MFGNKISDHKGEKKSWLLAFLIFLNFLPYFVWHIGDWSYLITLPTILILFLNSDFKAVTKPYFVFWILTIIVAALCSRNNILGVIMMPLTYGLVFSLKEQYLTKTYNKLYIIYSVTILISMFMWVLVVILSISVPYRVVEPLVEIKDYNYAVYPFLVRTNLDSINFESLGSMYRFCGLYDEPGVVGTLSFLFLSVEGFDFKNKWNIIILISGLLSMSLFFYLASTFYIAIILFSKGKFKLRTKLGFVVLIIGFAIFSYNNEILHTLVWERIEGRKSAQALVDSRSTDDLKKYVKTIEFSSEWFFGVSDRELIEKYSDGASIYNAVIGYGVFTLFLYAVFFTIYAFRFSKSSKSALVALAVIALTLIQRPGFFILYYLFLFRSIIIVPSVIEKRELLSQQLLISSK